MVLKQTQVRVLDFSGVVAVSFTYGGFEFFSSGFL